MTPEYLKSSCCQTCHFNSANTGKTGGEVCSLIAPMYSRMSNEKVAQIIWQNDAVCGMIHTCNQTNQAFGFTNPRPCRGFLSVLIEHVQLFDRHGYAEYERTMGMDALTAGQMGFWSAVVKTIKAAVDPATE